MKLKQRILLSAAAFLFGAPACSSFVGPRHGHAGSAVVRRNAKRADAGQRRNILDIRGGGDVDVEGPPSSSSSSSTMLLPPAIIGAAAEALRGTLVSGSPLKAVGALYACAALTILPLTWYRSGYSFSVGYGLSVAVMSAALLSSFGGTLSQMTSSPPSILALTLAFYGARLAAFIFLRERTVESKREAFDKMDAATPPLKRTPIALSVSLLYACMVSPALFAFRGAGELGPLAKKVQAFFAGAAAFGTALEAAADQHKYQLYRTKRGSEGGEDAFVGPTTWSYRLCRHPNYLGEILTWTGVFGAGAVSFGKSIVAWAGGVLGLWGILSVMLGSAARLDKRQDEKYGGQPKYDEWKGSVKASIFPLIK